MNREELLDIPHLFLEPEATSVVPSQNKGGAGSEIVRIGERASGGLEQIMGGTEGDESFSFELEAPADAILQMATGKIDSVETNPESVVKTYTPPPLPTIDWSALGDDEPEISVPVQTSETSPSPDAWTAPIAPVPRPRESPRTEIKDYTPLELGTVRSYLRKIQTLCSRIDTTDPDREISGISTLLYYMVEDTDTFFDYEQKWTDHKDEYIVRAKKANGNFFSRVKVFLWLDIFRGFNFESKRTQQDTHDLFVEEIQTKKVKFLKELLSNISPKDMLCITDGALWSEETEFQKKHMEEFEFLFGFYFQRLQELHAEKKVQREKEEWNKRRALSESEPFDEDARREKIVAAIQDSEDYFDKQIADFLDKKKKDDNPLDSEIFRETSDITKKRFDQARKRSLSKS